MVVDLPAPFGPRKPVMSPGATVRSRPSSALVRPKDLDRPRISTASCACCASPPQGRCRHRVLLLSVVNGMPCLALREERVVHRRVGHQAVGVDLEGGQHHLFAVVAQHRAQIGWVVVHLQVEQEPAAAGHSEVLGPGLRVSARLEGAGADALFEVLLGVVDHAAARTSLPDRCRTACCAPGTPSSARTPRSRPSGRTRSPDRWTGSTPSCLADLSRRCSRRTPCAGRPWSRSGGSPARRTDARGLGDGSAARR